MTVEANGIAQRALAHAGKGCEVPEEVRQVTVEVNGIAQGAHSRTLVKAARYSRRLGKV